VPFEGIPLERSKPRTQEDLELKLQTTRFYTLEQILDFYESNRELFSDSNHYEKILTPLAGLCKHKRAEIKDTDSKKLVP
jgi:hypothetical protein